MMLTCRLGLVIFALLLSTSAVGQDSRPTTAPATAASLEQVARLIVSSVVESPSDELKALLTPEFLKAAPWLQVRAILSSYAKRCGKGIDLAWIGGKHGARSGSFWVTTEKGFEFRCDLSLTPAGNGINGLLFQEAQRRDEALGDVINDFKKFPGRTALCVSRLADSVEVIASHEPNLVLPTGSTFKLWILAALAVAVEDGTARWDEPMALRQDAMSAPSGRLHTWPLGTPITLQALAAAMISESDNTATDHLLKRLGREHVESVMTKTGHSAPSRNIPMMSTRELFSLKFSTDPDRSARYLKADVAQRRVQLDALSSMSLDDLAVGSAPTLTQEIEWFASPMDLIYAMNTLRRLSAKTSGAPVLPILGINPGFKVDPARYPVVAFKGGSEPGVLNLTWMWSDERGRWMAASLSHNRDDGPCDETRGARVGARIVEAARRSP